MVLKAKKKALLPLRQKPGPRIEGQEGVAERCPLPQKEDLNIPPPSVPLGETSLITNAIIKFPLTTESAMMRIEDNNTLIFLMDIKANKHPIKEVVKKLYDINMVMVNMLIQPDGEKRAYIQLPPDYDALDVANKTGII
ncbi:60S ribosomal protein L23a-like [Trichosurus vulpecula]|uniref:60S ribosomal protein L23a-like n=1 Tax=Trichosurus vulpecula TaxID=9337 RepID=UPI00186B01B1|nr:60S ribosomal protein L23a-like [Trichosurus vulpecula]